MKLTLNSNTLAKNGHEDLQITNHSRWWPLIYLRTTCNLARNRVLWASELLKGSSRNRRNRVKSEMLAHICCKNNGSHECNLPLVQNVYLWSKDLENAHSRYLWALNSWNHHCFENTEVSTFALELWSPFSLFFGFTSCAFGSAELWSFIQHLKYRSSFISCLKTDFTNLLDRSYCTISPLDRVISATDSTQCCNYPCISAFIALGLKKLVVMIKLSQKDLPCVIAFTFLSDSLTFLVSTCSSTFLTEVSISQSMTSNYGPCSSFTSACLTGTLSKDNDWWASRSPSEAVL